MSTLQARVDYLTPGRLLPGTEGAMLENFAGLIHWVDGATHCLWSLDDVTAHINAAIVAVCGGQPLRPEDYEEFDISMIELLTEARDRVKSEAKCTITEARKMLLAILADASRRIE